MRIRCDPTAARGSKPDMPPDGLIMILASRSRATSSSSEILAGREISTTANGNAIFKSKVESKGEIGERTPHTLVHLLNIVYIVKVRSDIGANILVGFFLLVDDDPMSPWPSKGVKAIGLQDRIPIGKHDGFFSLIVDLIVHLKVFGACRHDEVFEANLWTWINTNARSIRTSGASFSRDFE